MHMDLIICTNIGIGKAIAAALALNGAKVYIAARKEALLKEAHY